MAGGHAQWRAVSSHWLACTPSSSLPAYFKNSLNVCEDRITTCADGRYLDVDRAFQLTVLGHTILTLLINQKTCVCCALLVLGDRVPKHAHSTRSFRLGELVLPDVESASQT